MWWLFYIGCFALGLVIFHFGIEWWINRKDWKP